MTVNTNDPPEDPLPEALRIPPESTGTPPLWTIDTSPLTGPPMSGPVDPHAVYRWPGGSGPLPPGGVVRAPRPEPGEAPAGWPHAWQAQQQPPVVVQQNTGPFPPYAPYRPPVNHVLHLILTLLTCGLWAPVWIVMAIIDAVRR